MDTVSSNNVLFGKTRTAVLLLLFGQPEHQFYLRQVARLSGSGLGAVQRELEQLTRADIVTRREQGRHVYYRVNDMSPSFDSLRRIFAAAGKTSSAVAAIPAASPGPLTAFCRRHKIKRLSLFGSVLRSDFRPDSDVDVLVEFAPGSKPGFLGLQEMEAELSALFGGRRIDLRTAEDLSRYFRARVIKEAEVRYAADR
jgi:hypothetical protein